VAGAEIVRKVIHRNDAKAGLQFRDYAGEIHTLSPEAYDRILSNIHKAFPGSSIKVYEQ